MPSVSEVKTERRRVAIVNALGTPLTTAGIAKATGLTYQAVRRELGYLLDMNRIELYGTVDRSDVFIKVGAAGIPRFWDKISNRSITAYDMALHIADSNFQTKASQSSLVFGKGLVTLMYLARYGSADYINREYLADLRAVFRDAHAILTNHATMIEQAIENPGFWDPEFLIAMKNDPDYNPASVEEAYERMLRIFGSADGIAVDPVSPGAPIPVDTEDDDASDS